MDNWLSLENRSRVLPTDEVIKGSSKVLHHLQIWFFHQKLRRDFLLLTLPQDKLISSSKLCRRVVYWIEKVQGVFRGIKICCLWCTLWSLLYFHGSNFTTINKKSTNLAMQVPTYICLQVFATSSMKWWCLEFLSVSLVFWAVSILE